MDLMTWMLLLLSGGVVAALALAAGIFIGISEGLAQAKKQAIHDRDFWFKEGVRSATDKFHTTFAELRSANGLHNY